jgi:3-hydroxyisobutyrate dehydrogenase-like beta-hydroxyacid dehydrogenase
MSVMQHVALIGLGLLGSAIAGRLAAAGYQVHGHDVDGARREAFGGQGRLAAESLSQAVKPCDTVVLAVFDTAQVEAVTEGEGGLASLARATGRRLTVICTSTCDPDRIAALAQRACKARLDFVELPVSGTSAQVARGEGVGLVGGTIKAVEKARAVIDAICPRTHYLGEAGNGGRAKLAVNLVLGLNRAAMAEGLAFAERAGLPLEEFFGVLRGSAAYSAVMDTKGQAMVQGKYDAPQSRVDQSLKDFRLMQDYGWRRGQQLPFAALYVDMLNDCVAQGEGQWDNAAIIEALRRRRT